MVYRFLMLSDEVEDFKREYRIDGDATFKEFHDIIVDSVGYNGKEMSSFFLCGDDWSQETEITLEDMGTSSEVDVNIMSECVMSDFLEEEKQKIMFVFDYMTERAFFMELREITYGESITEAEVVKAIGKAPEQFMSFEEDPIIMKAATATTAASILDDDFYGDDGYNDDELDAEGFDGLDEGGNSISIDDLENI